MSKAQEQSQEVRPADVWEAKLAIMRRVGYVHKTGSMKQVAGKVLYTFASDQDLLRALRPWLLEYGVTLTRREIKSLSEGSYPTRSGEAQRVRYVAVWEFRHVASKTVDVIEVLAEAGDSGDKCGPKANTCSLKYALIDYFQLPRGDAKEDPDAEIPEGRVRRSESFQACRDTLRAAPNLQLLERYRNAMAQRGYTSEELAELTDVWQESYRTLVKAGMLSCRSLEHLDKYRRSFEHKQLLEPVARELRAVYQERFNGLGGRQQQQAPPA